MTTEPAPNPQERKPPAMAPAQASTRQDGPSTTGPGPKKKASEYERGAAFAHSMFVHQLGAGQPASLIEERQQAAEDILSHAARDDADREFLRGYANAGAGHLAALRTVQRSEQAAGQREHAASQQAEREAGAMDGNGSGNHPHSARPPSVTRNGPSPTKDSPSASGSLMHWPRTARSAPQYGRDAGAAAANPGPHGRPVLRRDPAVSGIWAAGPGKIPPRPGRLPASARRECRPMARQQLTRDEQDARRRRRLGSQVLRAQLMAGMPADRIEQSADRVLAHRIENPTALSTAFYDAYSAVAYTYAAAARAFGLDCEAEASA